ncbi:MAG: class D sortase [Candidatus Acidiferrales bacterium]|jgi:sortase A
MIPVSHLTKPRHAARTAVLRIISGLLVLIGIVALGYSGYVVEEARSYQAVHDRNFETTVLEPTATSPSTAPAEGNVIGRLQIPRLGLRAIVAQGDSAQVLRHAVGHVPDTTLPGDDGNVVLAGHRDTFFRSLRLIRPGDMVTFETPGRALQYQVEWTEIVPPSDLSVLETSREHELTLITCFPFDYVGSAPDRFIVRAREVSQTP